MKVLSLGWGVQSWTLAAMVALGELEPIDFAVHADTTWERKQTYEFAARWTPWLERQGVKVVTAKADSTAPVLSNLNGTKSAVIPAYTGNGVLTRICTRNWKVDVIRRFISNELNRRSVKKRPGVVEMWLGISEDEWHRAKDSPVKYVTHRHPLLEMNMRRSDCIRWLDKNGLEVPGKSSCVFCPYLNRSAWQEMKRMEPDDWKTAVEIDLQIRDARPPYPLFVHSSCLPLAEAISIPEDAGFSQIGIFDAECDSGHCFL